MHFHNRRLDRYTHEGVLQDPNIQKNYVKWLQVPLKVKSPEDWYNVKIGTISKQITNIQHVLTYYDNDFIKLLSHVYPAIEWLPWKFSKVPDNYWNDVNHQKQYMRWLSTKLNIITMEDYYKLKKVHFLENYGGSLLQLYDYSVSKLVTSLYPDYDWKLWLFESIPNNLWDDPKTQRKYLEWLGNQLGFASWDDWYRITNNDFLGNKGSGLLRKYNSYSNMLTILVPEHAWKVWKFDTVPKGFWSKIENQKEYIEWLSNTLGYTHLDDWYKLRPHDLISNHGSGLLSYYGSVIKLVTGIFNDNQWLTWKFNNVGKYWESLHNQKEFLDWLFKELQLQSLDDWYQVTSEQIKNYGGDGLLERYGGSVIRILESVYPNYSWQPWKRIQVSKGFWKNHTNVKDYINELSTRLNIKELSDWYNVTPTIVHETGLKVVWSNLDQLIDMLKIAYEGTSWDYRKFRVIGKSQTYLKGLIMDLFPDKELIENWRNLDVLDGKMKLELDIYLPSIRLAFEYHGAQHYVSRRIFGSIEQRKSMDSDKIAACVQQGITLIVVPFWWDMQKESLISTIKRARPDVLFDYKAEGLPIPETLPPDFKLPKSETQETDVNDKVISRVFSLATNWNKRNDPTNWWMTEKFDGMRAYWDGKSMWSRVGREIKAPKEFTGSLPRIPLDGELWSGYGKYSEICGLANTQKPEKWKNVQYLVFDSPSTDGTYEQRISMIQQFSLPDHVKIVKPVKCEGSAHLDSYLREVLSKGGEGLVLRSPKSGYEPGRSKSMKRVKEFQDTEVKFARLSPNFLGLVCRDLKSDVELVVKCDSFVYSNPPKEGDIITVKHQGFFPSGKLKDPIFFRKRLDSI